MQLRSGSQPYSCLPYFFLPPPAFKYRHRIRSPPVSWCLPQHAGAVINTRYQTCHFVCQLPPKRGGRRCPAPRRWAPWAGAMAMLLVVLPNLWLPLWLCSPKAGARCPSSTGTMPQHPQPSSSRVRNRLLPLQASFTRSVLASVLALPRHKGVVLFTKQPLFPNPLEHHLLLITFLSQ